MFDVPPRERAWHMSPTDYGHLVIHENYFRRAQLQTALHPFLVALGPDVDRYNFVVVGSDGKNERYPQSRTEVVAFRGHGAPSIRELLTEHLKGYPRLHIETADDGLFGEYDVDGEVPLSFQYGNPAKMYPDFLMQSLPLIDDPNSQSYELYTHTRMRVLQEMSDPGKLGKDIREEMRKELSAYRQGIATGIYSGVPIFSTDTGQVFYDEGEHDHHKVFGFKVPFLRTVQRKLDILTAKYIIKSGNRDETIADLAVNLPTSSVGRIEYLSKQGVVRPEAVEPLSEAYYWFLQQQHHAQARYKQERTAVSVDFDPEKFESHRNKIIEFVVSDSSLCRL